MGRENNEEPAWSRKAAALMEQVTSARHALCRGVAVAAVLLVPSSGQAFRSSSDLPNEEGLSGEVPATWQVDRLGVFVDRDVPMEASLDALALWSGPMCPTASSVLRPSLQLREEEATADISVRWTTLWTHARNELGSTEVVYQTGEAGPAIVGATIELNAPLIRERRSDVARVISHELGHALGLLHPCRGTAAPEDTSADVCSEVHDGALMHPLYLEGNGATLGLGSDDKAGICALYGEDADCVGETCGRGAFGDACIQDQACQSGVCSRTGACTERCMGGVCGPREACENGVCEPVGEVFGAPCMEGADCVSRLCLRQQSESICTRDCEGGCPPGSECGLVEDRAVCVPQATGCTLSYGAESHRGDSPLIVALLSLAFLFYRRQRFRPQRSRQRSFQHHRRTSASLKR